MEIRECLSCDDVLLVPHYSDLKSRSECDPSFYHAHRDIRYSLPVIPSPMDKVYSKEMASFLYEKDIPHIVHRYYANAQEQLKSAVNYYLTEPNNKKQFFAVGSVLKNENRIWIEYLMQAGIRNFSIDMAHGDTKACVDTIKFLREANADYLIMAGDVATKSGFGRLQDAGADMIRVGIGSGSICSTRIKTGFGVPLLTSIADCAVRKENAILIADGGMKNAGDIVKAIAFGADMAMLGRQFAATDMAPGACYNAEREYLCEYNDINTCRELVCYKKYQGMASEEARKGVLSNASIEGVSGLIEYAGSTEKFLYDLKNNMQAALSYGGQTGWGSFRKKVKIIRQASGAISETQTYVIKEKV